MGNEEAVTLITASRRYQLATADLQFGMFVAELDRPWVDTPFLLQGFLIDSQVELDTLRKYCSYVYVDLEVSNPEVCEAIRRSGVHSDPPGPALQSQTLRGEAPAAEPELQHVDPPTKPLEPTTGAPPEPARRPLPRTPRRRADVRVSASTRQRFRHLVRATAGPDPFEQAAGRGWLGRAFGWLRRTLAGGSNQRAAVAARDRASRDAIKAHLPADMPLVEYVETRGFENELPRARNAFARGEEVLKSFVSDVKSGRIPQVAEVATVVDDMVGSMIDNPDALLWIGRLREEHITTYNKGVTVALYLIALGRQIGLPKRELSMLGMIGMLADVGNMKLDRSLLEKPRTLSAQEYELVKAHVELGLESLRSAGELPPEVELGISQHHERLDGTGYPRGLKGDQISIYGRMAAIADVFAALITPRAYANPSSPQDALMSLYEWAGTLFHEPLVEQFVQAVSVFPVGSLVELSSGEVAIVVAHNRVRRLEPRVLVLTWPDKSPLAQPLERDLLTDGQSSNARTRIVRGLAAGAYGLKLRDYYMGEVARANELPG